MPSNRSRPRRADDPRARALAAIRRLVASLYRSARSVESRTGRTNAQIAVLRAVARANGASVNDIAARVRVGQSAVSIVLSRLERARLVRKTASASDGRQVCVELTEAGRLLLRRAPKPATTSLIDALERLSPSEAAVIEPALLPLLKHLSRGTRGQPMLFE